MYNTKQPNQNCKSLKNYKKIANHGKSLKKTTKQPLHAVFFVDKLVVFPAQKTPAFARSTAAFNSTQRCLGVKRVEGGGEKLQTKDGQKLVV